MFGLRWFYMIKIILIANIIVILANPQRSGEKLKRLPFLTPSEVLADDECAPVKVDNCNSNNIFYTYDGSCNNLEHSNYGQAGHPFDRILDASFADVQVQRFSENHKKQLRTFMPRLSKINGPLPNARLIRTALLPNGEVPDGIRNALFYAFGQYSSYDSSEHRVITRIARYGECCNDKGKPVDPMPYECLPSIMPTTDEFYSIHKIECVDATRSINTDFLRCSSEKPVRQINHQTAFLDLSFLYGNSEKRAKRIKSIMEDGYLDRERNYMIYNQEYPIMLHNASLCPRRGLTDHHFAGVKCFNSGDDRLHLNPELFTMNTVFFRLHNFIVRKLKELHEWMGQKELYSYARRICIAIYQNIFFSEYVKLLIGSEAAETFDLLPKESGHYDAYNPKISPQTFHEYSSAVGRSGHSTVKGVFNHHKTNEELYSLRNTYYTMNIFLKKNAFLLLMKSFASTQCGKQDQFFSKHLNNFLFGDLEYGNDLSALTINRGREFGLMPYTHYRKLCGVDSIDPQINFGQPIKPYDDVDDIDLYVGGIREKRYSDSTLGPTFTCLMATQFQHWKFGDRLYFEFPSAKFSDAELQVIRSIKFSHIICLTTPELTDIQEDAFQIESEVNRRILCSNVRKDFTLDQFTFQKDFKVDQFFLQKENPHKSLPVKKKHCNKLKKVLDSLLGKTPQQH